MGFFTKLFGTYSQRQIKRITSKVNQIEALADKYSAMTDDELRATTDILKKRLAEGETLDDILVDAFAAVREAADRVLGKRPFRVQLMGGIILHQGRIAEMKTGEGKTLVAVLPAYLNALSGNSVHIVTVNEYLARVGAEEMGRVYGFMGLTTGLIVRDQKKEEKQAEYNCDIIYGTNNEFGFDYLRDNMVIYKEQKVQRDHAFAIVDEVDSILIDEARTPLIISGEGDEPTDIYAQACKFVRGLREYRKKEIDSKTIDKKVEEEYDYTVDEKSRSTVLTSAGVEKAESFFGIENLSDPENSAIAHQINMAIQARAIKHRDEDYIVDQTGKVVIVDTFTGRLMPGRRFSDGLHQAIEAKENVKIEKESKTLATITFQNYFRLYGKFSGMTGTALTEDMEFREIYALDVVEIPTNKPMIRNDMPDAVYRTVEIKYNAICDQIEECHKKGQPVLVGTVSVDKSELISRMLQKRGIPHKVLNAKHHEKEAEIVAAAGKKGAVTIATNMAGRGTDIMLGGNPEHMAKKEMRSLTDPQTNLPLYDDDMIGAAVGSSVNVSDEVLKAREVYKKLYEKYKNEIQPEADLIKSLGGLYIIGTERHESRRIDNQLRGRAGRQGDPGASCFFLSLEDDLMRLFGSERIAGVVDKLGIGEERISAGVLSGSIERAQKQLEGQNFQRRKNVLSYDDIMNEQRKIIYKQRNEVLDGADISEKIQSMIRTVISEAVARFLPEDEKEDWKLDELRSYFLGVLCDKDSLKYTDEELEKLEAKDVEAELIKRAEERYEERKKMFGDDLKEVERVILLRSVDAQWIEHLDAMDDLKGGISLQAYAQRNPINEFRIESGDMFDIMISEIREETMRKLLTVFPASAIQRKEVARVTSVSANAAENFKDNSKAEKGSRTTVIRRGGVAKNAACPCGSGKKFKQCCGKGLF
ncbi:MAG: preprotein translocase subunit SecA [Clostridia bacterium]|nr:preprotein translocase subunit SecA [Clostridia bacterium]